MKKVSVSFLSSKDIINDLKDLNNTDIDYIHVDVMDGKFVDNKNDPFKYLNKLFNIISKRLDVHLMCKKPRKYIDKYALLNTEYITIHIEIDNVLEYLRQIKSYGIKCGIAINPSTDIEKLNPVIDFVDMILIMSVEPGRGGQPFIEESYDRLKQIKKLIGNRKIDISMDGGIDDEVSEKLDTNIVVSGSYVISNSFFQENIDKLR